MYAQGYTGAGEHVVQRAGVRIIAHTLDLRAPPAVLLGAVQALADTMVLTAGFA